MSRRNRHRQAKKTESPQIAVVRAGIKIVAAHPLFRGILDRCRIHADSPNAVPTSGWATVARSGSIFVRPRRGAAAEEWAYVLAHCLLHLGLDHFVERADARAWNAACCAAVAKFLASVKIGRPPLLISPPDDLPGVGEQALYRELSGRAVPAKLGALSAAGDASDLVFDRYAPWHGDSFSAAFAQGLRVAVSEAVANASGQAAKVRLDSAGELARRWFINHYPLLGSLAAVFTLVEDPATLARMNISIAAVSPALKEIYLNANRLSPDEITFVIAHELLHVGLRHDQRQQGRDPFLWNVACDYVINGWLVEMGVGTIPSVGALHDPAFANMSAEAVYDLICQDLRRARKLASFRGVGIGDVLADRSPSWWQSAEGTAIDDYYRSCLAQGLDFHAGTGRGTLPAGLVEEIRALAMPPIPWEVNLARWFDARFAPLARRRTYARPSRRQASTPDIPRPRWFINEEDRSFRTFGVVLDTSGSMDRHVLARALGAIASYADAREVPAARVIFCDAAAHDQGYLPVLDIASKPVKVVGRGGTVLQPAIDLLRRARDFPERAPILVITDGWCDRLQVPGDHAYLIPAARALPFSPAGPVFRVN